MNRLLLLFSLSIICLYSYGQGNGYRSLHYYIGTAKEHSPLITDYRNQTEIEQAELDRLKAMYTHSRLELNGDYLFVPVISKDGGRAAFKWNARSATDYYGYDLGESSGYFHAGVTWTQPLLGRSSYKAAQEQAKINTEMANNRIRMEEHQLERSVTEHYLLCLLDKAQMDFTDSVGTVIDHQMEIVQKLLKSGLSKQSDLNLLMIEKEANAELHAAACQDYHTHLMDLNLLCGIDEVNDVALSDINLPVRLRSDGEPEPFYRAIPIGQLEYGSFPTFLQSAIQAQAQPVRKQRSSSRRLFRLVSPFRAERGGDILMDHLRRQTEKPERTSSQVATEHHTELQGELRISTEHENRTMPLRVEQV